jgi:hypothetical protein
MSATIIMLPTVRTERHEPPVLDPVCAFEPPLADQALLLEELTKFLREEPFCQLFKRVQPRDLGFFFASIEASARVLRRLAVEDAS